MAWRRILSWGGYGALGFLGALALAALLSYGLVQTEWAKDKLRTRIEAALSGDGGSVAIGALEGHLPSEIRFRDVSAADRNGPWLRAADIRLDWKPWRLMLGAIDVVRLEGTGVEISRLPEGGGGGEDGFTPPDFSIDLATLRIEGVLGPSFLGESAPLLVAGDAHYAPGRALSAVLEASQGGLTGSRSRARIAYRPRTDIFELDVEMRERPGGLIARLLKLKEGGEISLSGQGALSDWRGALKANIGGIGEIDATLRLSDPQDALLRAEGSASLVNPLGGRLASLTAAPQAFAAKIRFPAALQLAIERARLSTPGMEAELAGSIDLAKGRMDLGLKANRVSDASVAALLTPATAEKFTLAARLSGKLDAPDFAFDATAETMRLSDFQFDSVRMTGLVDLSSPPQGASLGFEIEGEAQAANLQGVSHGPFSFSGSGAYFGREDRVAIANAEIRPKRYGEIALRGDLFLAAEADETARLSAQAALRALPLEGEIVRAVMADPLEAEAEIVYREKEDRIALSGVTLRHRLGEAKGAFSYSLASDAMDARFALAIPDGAALSPFIGAALDVAPLAIDASFRREGGEGGVAIVFSPWLSLSGVSLSDVRLQAALAASAGKAAALSLTFSGPAGDFAGSADLIKEDRTTALAFERIRMTMGGATATGRVTIPDKGPLDGRVIVDAPSVAPLSAIAGLRLEGRARLEANVFDRQGRQAISGAFTGEKLRLFLSPSQSIAADAASLTIGDGDPSAPFLLEIARLSGANFEFPTIVASGVTDFRSAHIALASEGSYRGKATLAAEAHAEWMSDRLRVELATLDAQIGGSAVRLEAPASLTFDESGVALSALALTLDDGRVAVSGKRGPQSLAAKLRLDDVPLSLAKFFSPLAPAAGAISGEAEVLAETARAEGAARFTISGLRFGEELGGVSTLDGEATANWRNGRLGLRLSLAGTEDASAEIAAALPLRFDPESERFVMAEDGAVEGRLVSRTEVAPIWSAFGPDGHRLSGRADANLTLSGTLSEPHAEGAVHLARGRYVFDEFGTVLEDLSVSLSASKDRIALESAKASDGGGGALALSGHIELDPARGFPSSFVVTADDAKLVRRSDVEVTASGELFYRRSGEAASLEGSIRTKSIDALLVNLPSSEVVPLEVIEIGPDGEILARTAAEPAPEIVERTALAIDVRVPGRAFIRGRGLDSEWSGRLSVGGVASEPEISGAFDLVRGRFEFAGRAFTLTEGKVTFRGGPKIDPELDLEAIYEAGDLKAVLRLTGPSSKPKIALTSEPVLPQDEILARILFGSSVATLTPIEALQLADAVRSLASPSGGMIGKARSSLGLDVLRVGGGSEAAEGATTITGGKYLKKNVYVEVETSTQTGQEKVGVEVGVSKNLSVESDLSRDGGSRIGLKWKRDY